MNSFVVAVPFLLVSVTPVLAHAMLDHASPRVGSTVAPAPKEVVLWFTQKLEPAFSSIEVRNEQGVAVNAGKATVVGDRTQLRVPVRAPGGDLQSDLARSIGRYPSHPGRLHLPRRTVGLVPR